MNLAMPPQCHRIGLAFPPHPTPSKTDEIDAQCHSQHGRLSAFSRWRGGAGVFRSPLPRAFQLLFETGDGIPGGTLFWQPVNDCFVCARYRLSPCVVNRFFCEPVGIGFQNRFETCRRNVGWLHLAIIPRPSLLIAGDVARDPFH